jgi:hypothetical protein
MKAQNETVSCLNSSCPFRKFHPAQIRIVRQNHCIIESDDCNAARARNRARSADL